MKKLYILLLYVGVFALIGFGIKYFTLKKANLETDKFFLKYLSQNYSTEEQPRIADSLTIYMLKDPEFYNIDG